MDKVLLLGGEEYLDPSLLENIERAGCSVIPTESLERALRLLDGGEVRAVLGEGEHPWARRLRDAFPHIPFLETRPRDPQPAAQDLIQEIDTQALLHLFASLGLVGSSPVMRQVYDLVRRVSQSSSTVLIQGESGTGKELVAHAIHDLSPRRHHPFVTLNCCALSEGVLESELFGHEKGSFTGAYRRHLGRFEMAHRGTLFIDEVGEIGASTQAKLLRVLQEKEFERMGGGEPIAVDVRLIAAANRSLEEAVLEGRFREDLYYRLNVVAIRLPPLRERKEDIPFLATHFLAKYGDRNQKPELELSPGAMSRLIHHTWPGNVRELEHAIERAVVLAESSLIRAEDLPGQVRKGGGGPRPESSPWSLRRKEKEWIELALAEADGNLTLAARLLEISRGTLYSKMKRLSIPRRPLLRNRTP